MTAQTGPMRKAAQTAADTASSGVPTGRSASLRAGGVMAQLTALTTRMRWAAESHPRAVSIAALMAPAASPTTFCATERGTAPTARMSVAADHWSLPLLIPPVSARWPSGVPAPSHASLRLSCATDCQTAPMDQMRSTAPSGARMQGASCAAMGRCVFRGSGYATVVPTVPTALMKSRVALWFLLLQPLPLLPPVRPLPLPPRR